MERFFRFFEGFADPFASDGPGRPQSGGLAFIRHYAGQMKRPFLVMLALGGLTALVEAALFVFVGWIVDMMNASAPETLFSDNMVTLLAMAGLVAILRAIIAVATAVTEEQVIVPGFFNMVRWQAHKSITRQDVSFFDDEMAGRVAAKVWQGGQAAGDFMISLLQIIWFIVVFIATSLIVIAGLDWRMLVPVLFWLALVGAIARYTIPRIRQMGRETAEAGSVVSGRMVDGYSNIRTVKLYGAEGANDEFVKRAWDEFLAKIRRFTRWIATMRIAFQCVSSVMLVIIAGLALWLYTKRHLSAGEVTVVLALCLRLNLLLGRLLGLLNGLFRNFGTVQNSAALIAKQPQIVDRPDAVEMSTSRGGVAFRNIHFAYASSKAIIDGLTLDIPPGQRLGIVGKSGAGKSTLMNLLLRFHDLQSGTIEIDGIDIAGVTQHSLRSQMGIVTQDTALLHRSIRDNIAYGRRSASDDAVIRAAKRAKAHDFIVDLQDVKGRRAYETHVGERGVKLSGGQRQRIALARVFLKDAPILLLDEATSSLDSEVEAAIQEHLEELMEGKTVIAIAHRLSTIAHLERLIVVEDGAIVEDGNHKTLLKKGGRYAKLWERQSGGFLNG